MTSRIEYVFLELPNCKDPEDPEAGELDRLCYTLANISEMARQPEWAKGEFFDLLFKSAEICNFAPYEQNEYIKDMTTERDIQNQMAFALNKSREDGMKEGREEGREEGVIETVRKFIAAGASVELIQSATGLPAEKIAALR